MHIYIFEAVWCNECIVMKPLWRNLKLEFPELKIKHFEFDDNKAYCKTFGIIDVPTAIFIDENGKELQRIFGLQHRDIVIDLINKYKNL